MSDRDSGDRGFDQKDAGKDVSGIRDVGSEVASEVARAAASVVASVNTGGMVQNVVAWESNWNLFWQSLPKDEQTGKLKTAHFTEKHWQETVGMQKQCDARIVAFSQLGDQRKKAAENAGTNLKMADDNGSLTV